MKRTVFVVASVLILFSSVPAQAHTDEEVLAAIQSIEDQRGWFQSFLPQVVDVDNLIDALQSDWLERHPCRKALGTWVEEECARLDPPTHSEASQSLRPSTGSGVEGWRSLVAAYFPTEQVDRALCIMSHESGGNPNADNPRSSAAGLFQFLRGTWDSVPSSITGGSYSSGQVYAPEPNIAAAAWLWSKSGWSPWSPWNRGLCR